MDEVTIKNALEKYGKIKNIHLPKIQGTNKFKGYGFIYFLDYDTADKICLYKEIKINGHKISVEKAVDEKYKNDRNLGRVDFNNRGQSSQPRTLFGQDYLPDRQNDHRQNQYLRDFNGNQSRIERDNNRWGAQETPYNNICRFHLQGRCKFGTSCRKSHQGTDTPRDTMRRDDVQTNRNQRNNNNHFLGIESIINQEVKRQIRNYIRI